MNRFRICGLSIILVAILSAACQPKGPATLSDADKAAIKKTTDQALAMYSAPTKDWAAFVKFFYSEDAIALPPNAPAVKGHEALIALLQTNPPFSDYKQELLEIEGFGNLAYDLETWSVTIAQPGAPAFTDTGKLIWIWRKQADGSWKVWREMWSSDLPAPVGAAPAEQK